MKALLIKLNNELHSIIDNIKDANIDDVPQLEALVMLSNSGIILLETLAESKSIDLYEKQVKLYNHHVMQYAVLKFVEDVKKAFPRFIHFCMIGRGVNSILVYTWDNAFSMRIKKFIKNYDIIEPIEVEQGGRPRPHPQNKS